MTASRLDAIREQANRDLHRLLCKAIADPARFTPRGDNYAEDLTDWQARAVQIALADLLAVAEAVEVLFRWFDRARSDAADSDSMDSFGHAAFVALVKTEPQLRAALSRLSSPLPPDTEAVS